MTLVESMSARVHTTDCFHIQRHPGTIYKRVLPSGTREEVREFIKVRSLASRCCGSCLAWAVTSG